MCVYVVFCLFLPNVAVLLETRVHVRNCEGWGGITGVLKHHVLFYLVHLFGVHVAGVVLPPGGASTAYEVVKYKKHCLRLGRLHRGSAVDASMSLLLFLARRFPHPCVQGFAAYATVFDSGEHSSTFQGET